MNISVIGVGYVGLVTGACLAEVGNNVLCLDIDAAKISALKAGQIPIHEPGLTEMVQRNVAAGRLHFTTDIVETSRHGSLQFITVDTPPDINGAADLQYVEAAARTIGRHMQENKIIINKSTVPIGTADRVRGLVQAELQQRGSDLTFSVISNPEFLKEGAAVDDFMRPDRIVIGADNEHAVEVMRALYAPFQRNHERLLIMDIKSAELTKYAANAMLATRISFMNELALLADQVGADINQVRKGIGSDARIGYDFLYAGCGYGGACFPKDIKALRRTAGEYGGRLRILDAVEEVNERQKLVLLDKITARLGQDLAGKNIALWGLAFKPNTNDMREAPSRILIQGLWDRGATVTAYDPVAMPEAHRILGADPRLKMVDSPMAALADADCLAIVTEWKVFRAPDFGAIKSSLKNPLIFDGRNLYEPTAMREQGIEYFPIGRTLPGVSA
jgi:UDPglucose 6-dehydrogenase